jgi:3D (Asp-Asp-Asp) domain-containing protein
MRYNLNKKYNIQMLKNIIAVYMIFGLIFSYAIILLNHTIDKAVEKYRVSSYERELKEKIDIVKSIKCEFSYVLSEKSNIDKVVIETKIINNNTITKEKQNNNVKPNTNTYNQVKDTVYKKDRNITTSRSNYVRMRASAYSLDVSDTGKSKSHPAYGITKTGTKATYRRTIATDPKVIPLGSKVYIEFPEPYTYMNGNYIAEDTGGAIKGNKIDVFMGEGKRKQCIEFGIREVKTTIIREG